MMARPLAMALEALALLYFVYPCRGLVATQGQAAASVRWNHDALTEALSEDAVKVLDDFSALNKPEPINRTVALETIPNYVLLEKAYGGDLDMRQWTFLSPEEVKMLEEADGGPNGDVYGEINPEGVAQLLLQARVRPGETYVDLGSGLGKTVAVAWAMGLHGLGIEFSTERFALACGAAANLSSHAPTFGVSLGTTPRLQFARGSFTELDFSGADILFMDSQMFEQPLFDRIVDRARALRRGTRVISVYPLPGPEYRLLWTGSVPCSWTKVLWTVQEKVSEAVPAAAGPMKPSQAEGTCGLPGQLRSDF